MSTVEYWHLREQRSGRRSQQFTSQSVTGTATAEAQLMGVSPRVRETRGKIVASPVILSD